MQGAESKVHLMNHCLNTVGGVIIPEVRSCTYFLRICCNRKGLEEMMRENQQIVRCSKMRIYGMKVDDNGGILGRSERRLVANGRSGEKTTQAMTFGRKAR
ncbi:MAG: hypothetical protein Q7T00_08430 [Rugosibacter sp.]|nr:hypothetical protein [Rugosibacter sp.]